jgi:hypothetical protein
MAFFALAVETELRWYGIGTEMRREKAASKTPCPNRQVRSLARSALSYRMHWPRNVDAYDRTCGL